MKKKAKIDLNNCVACGTCLGICPVKAIDMVKGMFAKINLDKCVACGKCVKLCPASVIEIKELEADV